MPTMLRGLFSSKSIRYNEKKGKLNHSLYLCIFQAFCEIFFGETYLYTFVRRTNGVTSGVFVALSTGNGEILRGHIFVRVKEKIGQRMERRIRSRRKKGEDKIGSSLEKFVRSRKEVVFPPFKAMRKLLLYSLVTPFSQG